MVLIEKIIVPGVGKKGEVLKKQEVLDSCYELGKNLAIRDFLKQSPQFL